MPKKPTPTKKQKIEELTLTPQNRLARLWARTEVKVGAGVLVLLVVLALVS